jgi:S-disulfanyl-L-cysteine oxidoreductase SoxD
MSSSKRYLMTAAAVFAAAAIDVAGFSAQGGTTVWDGVYSADQSKRGEELSKATCTTCHGNELAGTDLAPALQGDDFKAVWTGRTAAELFDKIQTTMPADKVGTLKPPQSADLVAYILKMNNYPAGATELASEMPALQQIKITSKK